MTKVVGVFCAFSLRRFIGWSKNTIENYSFDIDRLRLFLRENKIEVSPIEIEEVIQQFIYAVSSEVNPRSQARIISGLRVSLGI
jgi:integrase/recombinase XerD